MWTYNYSNELYHHGVKGMRWGVRKYYKKDGSLSRAGLKRQATVDKELEFQKKKIKGYKETAKNYRESAEHIRKNGMDILKRDGYTNLEENKKYRDLMVKKLENEARWNEHIAKHIEIYNKKLSELDISDMTRFEVVKYYNMLGEQTKDEINRTWKEEE